MQIFLIKTVQPISAKMYYSLRYHKEETQLIGLFTAKGVVELKILVKYIYRNSKKKHFTFLGVGYF